jgi:hypothetical protein
MKMIKKIGTRFLLGCLLVVSLLQLSFSVIAPEFSKVSAVSPKAGDSAVLTSSVRYIYDSLQLDMAGLSRKAFDFALNGWEKLNKDGKLTKHDTIGIIDFSQPSTSKRLYVLDIKNQSLLFNSLVAHGRNSGKKEAVSFSNRPSSYKSSPGFYVTGDTYNGSNGFSLRLNGMEDGINDNAFSRGIVMHGANYVSESFITGRGYIGRSQGCPAVPLKVARDIINTMKGGACLYIYAPDRRYLSRSEMLNADLNS